MPLPKHHVPIPYDNDLVLRVQSGDESAFEELFRIYVAAMLRFAMSFVADVDAAEDIVQEVFGRVWLHRAEWRPSTDILSYLLAAVRNRALNAVTTDQRRTGIAQHYASANDIPAMGRIEPVDQAAEQSDQHQLIWRVAHALPERRRTVLLLRWRHGMEWEDIARIMESSVASVRMMHSRALQSLRERLPDALD